MIAIVAIQAGIDQLAVGSDLQIAIRGISENRNSDRQQRGCRQHVSLRHDADKPAEQDHATKMHHHGGDRRRIRVIYIRGTCPARAEQFW